MKKTRFFPAELYTPLFLFLVVAFGGLLPAACDRAQNPIVTEPDTPGNTDSSQCVAYFSPLEQALYVVPEYLERVLGSLGAVPTSSGSFEMVHPLSQGDYATLTFSVRSTPVESIAALAIQQDSILTQLVASGETANLPASALSYNYKECGEWKAPRIGLCQVIGDHSERTYTDSHRKCDKPAGRNSVCTEFRTQGYYENRYYANTNCDPPYVPAKTTQLWLYHCRR